MRSSKQGFELSPPSTMASSKNLRTSKSVPPFKWSHLWESAIVNPVNLRSYTIPLFNIRDPYARAFHFSWSKHLIFYSPSNPNSTTCACLFACQSASSSHFFLGLRSPRCCQTQSNPTSSSPTPKLEIPTLSHWPPLWSFVPGSGLWLITLALERSWPVF